MNPPIVVFDTSVLLSAIDWGGKPSRCLELARTEQIIGVTCREILEELSAKLESKLDFTPMQAAAVVADLLSAFTFVIISGDLRAVLADPKDDMILECGIVAGADFIVTGDRRHLLPIGTFQEMRIFVRGQSGNGSIL